MIDKKEAMKLRGQGLTYKQIAEMLGCSEVWCKKILKGVPRGVNPLTGENTSRQDAKMKAIRILEDALRQLRLV